MKSIKLISFTLCVALVIAGCGMTNTAKGGMIGAGGGAALGAVIGQLIGKDTKSTVIGGAIGTAVGTTAGIIIGKKMDKAKAAAQAVENAKVEGVEDGNGNTVAVKVTFDSGILFDTNKYALKAVAQNSLTKFANNVLNVYTDADVAIQGYTDSTGNDNINLPLSQNRADAVKNFLLSKNVSPSQIKSSQGYGSSNLILNSNGTEDKAASRRVEVLLYPSQAMLNEANAQAAQ
jgi:outer membrane protein OmpA-like peptidoglycan-associated protein